MRARSVRGRAAGDPRAADGRHLRVEQRLSTTHLSPDTPQYPAAVFIVIVASCALGFLWRVSQALEDQADYDHASSLGADNGSLLDETLYVLVACTSYLVMAYMLHARYFDGLLDRALSGDAANLEHYNTVAWLHYGAFVVFAGLRFVMDLAPFLPYAGAAPFGQKLFLWFIVSGQWVAQVCWLFTFVTFSLVAYLQVMQLRALRNEFHRSAGSLTVARVRQMQDSLEPTIGTNSHDFDRYMCWALTLTAFEAFAVLFSIMSTTEYRQGALLGWADDLFYLCLALALACVFPCYSAYSHYSLFMAAMEARRMTPVVALDIERFLLTLQCKTSGYRQLLVFFAFGDDIEELKFDSVSAGSGFGSSGADVEEGEVPAPAEGGYSDEPQSSTTSGGYHSLA